MNGNFYANLFVHFIPEDHEDMNKFDHMTPHGRNRIGGHEENNHSPEELMAADDGPTDGQTPLHAAAASGDIQQLEKLLNSRLIDINSVDSNGWQPLHEAVHSGSLEATKLLLSRGADLSAQTNNGGTALWWAKGTFDENHPVVRYLEEIGAPDSES